MDIAAADRVFEGVVAVFSIAQSAVAPGLVGQVGVGAGGAPAVGIVSAGIVVDSSVDHGHAVLVGHGPHARAAGGG